MNEGWKCPVCGRVFSPIIPECNHCSREAAIVKKIKTTIKKKKGFEDIANPIGHRP